MVMGDNIKRLRTEACMTQGEFGQALGVTYTTVCRWERGKSPVSIRHMRALSDFCSDRRIKFSIREEPAV